MAVLRILRPGGSPFVNGQILPVAGAIKKHNCCYGLPHTKHSY